MTTFDNREKAAENKYAHDQEVDFRIHARRNKLLGQWAAARMNLSGAMAEDYTKSLVAATLDAYDDDHVVARLKADLSAKGITISEQDVREELFRVTQIAKDQVSNNG